MAKVLFGERPKKKRRRPPEKISVIISAANSVLLLAVILLSLPLAVPRAFGYQPYTVVSGSMEPSIPVGSLVFVKNKNPLEIADQEVAAFYKNGDPGTIIVHRVMDNDTASGLLTTKGDANPEADFEPVPYSDCIGTVAKSFAGLGGVADAMTSGAGKIAIFSAIGIIACLQLFSVLWDKKKSRDIR